MHKKLLSRSAKQPRQRKVARPRSRNKTTSNFSHVAKVPRVGPFILVAASAYVAAYT